MKTQTTRNAVFPRMMLALLLLSTSQAHAGECYLPGDANLDGKVDISDPVAILGWLFMSGEKTHFQASDVNLDGVVDITDAIHLFNYLFQGSAPPVQGEVWVGNCGPSPSPPPKTFDNVVLIEEDPCFEGVEQLSPHDLTLLGFYFSCPPSFASLLPGDILVGIDNGGYLREVTMAWHMEQVIYAQTSQATLEQVFHDGTFYSEIYFSPKPHDLAFRQPAMGAGGAGGPVGGAGGILFEYPETTLWAGTKGSVTLQAGEITLDPNVTLDMEFGWFELKRAEVDIEADYSGEIMLTAAFVTESSVAKEKELGTKSVTRYFVVGGVPVAATLDLTVSVGFSAETTDAATASVGAFANGKVKVGALYNFGFWDSWNDSTGNAGMIGPTLSVEKTWGMKAYIKADAKVTFYQVLGFTFFGKPYLGAEAKLHCGKIPWAVNVGCEVGAGAFFDFSWIGTGAELEPFDLSVPVIEGEIALMDEDGDMDNPMNGCTDSSF